MKTTEKTKALSSGPRRVGLAAAILAVPSGPATAGEWSGYVAVESRTFSEDAAFAGQEDSLAGSLVLEPEYQHESAEGRDSFTVKPFLRLDSQDSERSHFDLRELYWRRSADSWELLVGIDRVFWGVTESQHLVDVINQTDQVESPDGEDKLGQPMVKLTLVRDFGIFDLFLLPGFRERTFPGVEGRLRTPLPIDDNQTTYESGAEERHVDWAARWSHAVGIFDFGLSHFSGTSRDPRLVPGLSVAGEPVLVPLYDLIDQTGLDLQATAGSWLWKLEAIRRSGQGDAFTASVGGFEYTFWGLAGTNLDVGVLSEYHWDERGKFATSPFDDDLFVGTRVAFNDVQNTQVLAGAIVDRDSDARILLFEASRRIGSSWVIEVETRAFSGQPPTDPLASVRSDDYVQIGIQRHW